MLTKSQEKLLSRIKVEDRVRSFIRVFWEAFPPDAAESGGLVLVLRLILCTATPLITGVILYAALTGEAVGWMNVAIVAYLALTGVGLLFTLLALFVVFAASVSGQEKDETTNLHKLVLSPSLLNQLTPVSARSILFRTLSIASCLAVAYMGQIILATVMVAIYMLLLTARLMLEASVRSFAKECAENERLMSSLFNT